MSELFILGENIWAVLVALSEYSVDMGHSLWSWTILNVIHCCVKLKDERNPNPRESKTINNFNTCELHI